MKNRKIVVVAFLLISVMLLGVGYAALTDTLEIEGSVKADTSVSQTDFDDDVYFSGTSVVTDSTGNKAASQILEGRDNATITAQHFTTKNQKVKVKFTIQNDSTDFDAVVTPGVAIATGNVSVDNAGADHDPIFDVSWTWDEEGTDVAAATIAAGQSKDLWVTIVLNETPLEEHSASFIVDFSVNAQEKAQQDNQG